MTSKLSYINLIRQRSSRRSYKPEMLSDEIQEQIDEILKTTRQGCLLEADGARRTISSTVTLSPALTSVSG